MLDDDAVFEDRDLGVPGAGVRWLGADPVAPHQDPLHGLGARQELGLGQYRRAAPSGVAPVAAPLPLGLQPRRAADALDLGITRAVAAAATVGGAGLAARRPPMHNGVRRMVR